MSGSTETHSPGEDQRSVDVHTLSSWLIHNGAPRFTSRYSARALLPELATAFALVLGFEITTAAWLPISASALVVLPALLAGTLILVRLALRYRGKRRSLDRPHRPLVRIAATAFVVAFAAGTLTLWPVVFLVETVVITTCSRLAFVLTSSSEDASAIGPRQRRNLFLLCAVSVTVLTPLMRQLPSLDIYYPVQTLAGMLIAVYAVHLSSGSAELSRSDISDRWGYFTPSTGPLLMIVACQCVVLPYFVGIREDLWAAAPRAAVLVVACGAVWAQVQRARRPQGQDRRRGWSEAVPLLLWATLFLLAYPVVFAATVHLGYHDAIDVPVITGNDPLEAALFAFSVNVVYSMLAFALVALAVDRMATWVLGQLRVVKAVTKGLSAQLALILIATTFFLFAAETWEVVVETPREAEWRFWVLVGALLLGAFVFLTLDARTLIQRSRRFTHDSLREAVSSMAALEMGREEQKAAESLLPRALTSNATDLTLAMSVRRWANALLFLYFYQALIFLTLMTLSAITLWGVATLAVSDDVALTWICGDEAAAVEEPDPSTPLGACAEAVGGEARDTPWTRVALLLAAFATLERVIRTTTDPTLHESVFGPARRGLELRFATAVLLDQAEEVDPPASWAKSPPAQRRGLGSRAPEEETQLNA